MKIIDTFMGHSLLPGSIYKPANPYALLSANANSSMHSKGSRTSLSWFLLNLYTTAPVVTDTYCSRIPKTPRARCLTVSSRGLVSRTFLLNKATLIRMFIRSQQKNTPRLTQHSRNLLYHLHLSEGSENFPFSF